MSKSIALLSVTTSLALAGCVERVDLTNETTSLRVEILAPTELGSPDNRLADDDRTVQVKVTALDSFGDPDLGVNVSAKVYVEFLGTLTPALGAARPFATVPLVAGVSQPVELSLPRVYGPTTLWIEDDTAGGSYPTGTSPILWYQDPYLQDISTPRDLNALDALSSSPLQNKQVTVTGSRHGATGRIVVTGVYAQGYTISDVQCADEDGTPPCTTGDFDHVLVFSFSRPQDEMGRNIAVGQFIDGFAGGVLEFNGLTEIGFPQSFVTDTSVDLARVPPPAVVQTSWFSNLIEFEKHESGLIAIEGGTVCPLDQDYATYKQWKIDVGRGCNAPINIITAGVTELDPATVVGQQLTRVTGTLRPVSIGSFNVWIMYPRFNADIEL